MLNALAVLRDVELGARELEISLGLLLVDQPNGTSMVGLRSRDCKSVCTARYG